ncbi:MAG: hypothetical protein ACFFEY_15895 [Candidatus Thorarchaeota archaeon]
MNGEVIFFRLTDVGRSIDLNRAKKIFPGIPDKRIVKTKDTPYNINITETLKLELTQNISSESKFINKIDLQIRLYEGGVISLIARVKFENIELEKLHNLRKTTFSTDEGEFKVNQFLKFHFNKVFNQIKTCIEEQDFLFKTNIHEKYTLYCIIDHIENPKSFVELNKNYLANLLMGEKPDLNLNMHQIEYTLSQPFSFLETDISIFDFDRGLIFDPNRDYEDILLVVEISNYQLLELRALDYLLDKRLAIVEEDIRKIYFKSRTLGRRLNRKIGNLLRLRYDLTFVLENIANVSKFIGDYFLAQIYKYLAQLFELSQWSESIRQRLETFGDIYNVAQTNTNERFLLYVEILLSFIFIMEFVFLILDFFR